MTARTPVLGCGVLVATLLALALPAAQAEVRLQVSARGQVEVRVSPGVIGTWRPSGPVDASVLNPDGDLQGDGTPALARSSDGRSVTVAWTRPSEATAWAAVGTDAGWSTLPLPGSQGPTGTPSIALSEGTILVAWQETSPDRGLEVVVARVDATTLEVGETLRESGELLGFWGLDDNACLLLRVPDGFTDEVVAYVGPQTPAEPIVWDRFSLQFLPPSVRVGLPGLSEGRGQGSKQVTALHWWTTDGSLSAVAIVDDGASLGGEVVVVPADGRGSHSSALQEALRALR